MAWLVVRKWFQEILGLLASVCTVVYSTQSRISKRLPRNATRLRERHGSRTQSYFLWWPIGLCNLPGSLQVLNFPVSGRAWWQDYVHLRHLQIGVSLCLPITWRSKKQLALWACEILKIALPENQHSSWKWMVEWPIFTLRLWNPKGPKGDDHKVPPKTNSSL